MNEKIFVGGKRLVLHIIENVPERIIHLSLYDSSGLQEILTLAKSMGIQCTVTDRSALDKICPDVNHQGVVAHILCQKEGNEADLKSALTNLPKQSLWLICDQIQDPRNLGAILRNADAVGVTGVILSQKNSAPLSSLARKTSTGASETLNIFRVNALSRNIEHLKKKGIWIYGLTGESPTNLYDYEFSSPHIALVLGSEEKGMRLRQLKGCDALLSIGMFGKIQSLNASVACALGLYEIHRQRNHFQYTS